MRNLTPPTVVAAAAAWLIASAPPVLADVSYYTPPSFKHQVQPVYPDSARAGHETGSVLVKVLVGTNGAPKQFILFKSSGHKDLDDAVMAAAKASTYTPAMRGSSPQIAFFDVTYKFNLTGLAVDEGGNSDLEKKLAANPRDVSTRLSVGTVYLNQKKFGQAEQTFATGTQLVPTNAKLWAYEGVAYLQDGQTNNDPSKYKSASDAFDQALRLDPHVELAKQGASAYFNWGFHLQQTGDNATALQYAQKAVATDPSQAAYYILVGESQTATGDYNNAIATLKKAESIDKSAPGSQKTAVVTARIVADEGNAELMQGDQVNGMADLNRSMQIDSTALFAYEYKFSYYMRQKNPAAAITPLMQLVKLQPNEAIWQVQLGNVYLQENNAASAQQAFQKALALDPNNSDAQFGMADLDAATGNMKALDSAMQQITAKAPPKTAAQYEAIIAINLLNAGQSGKANYATNAQTYADQATKADPTNGQAWYALGVADAQVNHNDKATASAALKKAYDIFKTQNNAEMMKTVDEVYKQLNGTSLGGY